MPDGQRGRSAGGCSASATPEAGRCRNHPFAVDQAYYWIHYGRALARLRGRQDDAVMAMRTAEDIFPTAVRRNRQAHDAIATLLPHARRDATGTELRALAYRAGLPV